MRRQVSLINAAPLRGLSWSLFFAGMAILRTRRSKLSFTARLAEPSPCNQSKHDVQTGASLSNVMTKIYIDADGCPVKDEVYRVADRYKLPVVVVANKRLNLPVNSLLEMVVVTGA